MNKFISYRAKIMISVALLLICFLTIGFLEMYAWTRKTILDKAYEFINAEASACSLNIKEIINRIDDVSLAVLVDDDIQKNLKYKQKNDLKTYDEYFLNKNIREALAPYALLYTEIDSISVLSTDEISYQYKKNYRTNLPTYFNLIEKSHKIYDKNGQAVWYSSSDGNYTVLSCGRVIHDIINFKPIGILSVNISERYIYSIYKDLVPENIGEVYLIDETGKIISSYTGNNIGKIYNQLDIKQIARTSEYYEVLKNGDSIYVSQAMSNNWRLVLTIPAKYYFNSLAGVAKIFIISGFFMICFAIFVSAYVTRYLMKPIYNLSNAMSEFGKGKNDKRINIISNDELGMLCNTFNKMADDINILYKTTYEQKILQRETELRALQMQINPHFLYNTLDTINWQSRLNGVDDVGEMAYCLGALLRYSLSSGHVISMEKEVENLNIYLKIQKYRYGDKLKIDININEKYYNIQVPKLILQPIVENAIIHAVEKTLNTGIINVYIENINKNELLIHIKDNGLGMSQQDINNIFNNTNKVLNKGSHIGILNVHERLKMYYGNDYGITIKSEPEKGTCITLHINNQIKY